MAPLTGILALRRRDDRVLALALRTGVGVGVLAVLSCVGQVVAPIGVVTLLQVPAVAGAEAVAKGGL